MAVYLNNGVQFTITSGGSPVDLSTYISSITLNRNYDELEITSMGDLGHRFTAGLEASSITIDFFNDWATGKVGQTLDTLVGTVAACTVQPAAGAVSATNPKYSFNVLVNNITPVNGAVSDLATQSVTWNVSGAITKTTA